ncbi:hypothetical protein U0070_024039 [Myodes glareolus]|uniref:Fibronectin type-III domain-containing protein n=1 Tax=Myodes glareolus TaxID=447135 RepID=A0AAW0I0D0_MYOGA
MEGIVTIMGLKPETRYAVRLAALNGKGLGEISAATEFKTQPVLAPANSSTLVPLSSRASEYCFLHPRVPAGDFPPTRLICLR